MDLTKPKPLKFILLIIMMTFMATVLYIHMMMNLLPVEHQFVELATKKLG
jgi:hypothetical protein